MSQLSENANQLDLTFAGCRHLVNKSKDKVARARSKGRLLFETIIRSLPSCDGTPDAPFGWTLAKCPQAHKIALNKSSRL